MRYPAHAAFIAPAKDRAQLWRLILGVGVFALVVAACLSGLFAALAVWAGPEAMSDWQLALLAADTPVVTLMLLFAFVALWLGTLAAARLLHKRGLASLVGQNGRVQGDFLRGAGVAFAILMVSLGVFVWQEPVTPNLPLATWALFLPFALLALLIQTGAEELFFRGYLQQQLAARFGHPLVWMGLPAILFGFAHFDTGSMAGTAPVMLAAATLFGVLAADLTARTGSIAAAWGFHFANNCVALLAIAVPGSISGLSLYLTPFRFDQTDIILPMMLQDMAVTVLIWLVLRQALQR